MPTPDRWSTCVCGGSRERPNPDCERCEILGDLESARAEAERLRDENAAIRAERDALLGHVVRPLAVERDADGEWQYTDMDGQWIAAWEPNPETERWVALVNGVDAANSEACWQPLPTYEAALKAVRDALARRSAPADPPPASTPLPGGPGDG